MVLELERKADCRGFVVKVVVLVDCTVRAVEGLEVDGTRALVEELGEVEGAAQRMD
jgi:hypothetical protein